MKQRMALAAATTPMVWLLLLAGLAARGWFSLGHWPTCADPMAKSLGFGVHYLATVEALGFSPLIALGVVGLMLLLRRRDPNFRIRPSLVVLGASIGFSILFFCFDPFGLMLWLLD